MYQLLVSIHLTSSSFRITLQNNKRERIDAPGVTLYRCLCGIGAVGVLGTCSVIGLVSCVIYIDAIILCVGAHGVVS